MTFFISRHNVVSAARPIVGGFAHLNDASSVASDPEPCLLTLPMTRHDAGMATALEIFGSTKSAEAFSEGPFNGFRGDGWVYGQALLRESDFVGCSTEPALCALARSTYEWMLKPDGPLAHMNLTRCWNYLPEINGTEHDLERYRWFNIGRHAAFAHFGCLPNGPTPCAVPAACALGVGGDRVGIAFLAVDGEVIAIENEHQISAYDYPPDYGPKAPMFSRAVRSSIGGASCFFVSGTASITGHQTMHVGDVAAQTRLTLSHIERLLAQLPEPFPASSWYIKVYVRRPEDCETVMGVVRGHWPQAVAHGKVSLLIADICRHDLDVEIELCCGLLAAF